MSRKLQTLTILLATGVVAAAVSHMVMAWVRIQGTAVEYRRLGAAGSKPFAFAAGSSLMEDGLSWDQICQALDEGVETWFVPGSSPAEWEPICRRESKATLSFLVVSAYDLNEHFLCDFRSEVVPLTETIQDLWYSGADWHFCKRVISQYPLKYVRKAFPTVGRSQGVMAALREKVRNALKPLVAMESEAVPVVPSGKALGAERKKTEKITEWPRARMLRRLASMRAVCQSRQAFNGPKKLAFLRMLRQRERRGGVVVVVLPVSPTFAGEFLTQSVVGEFEDTLREAQRAVPLARWLRLDDLPELKSDEYFWDLVHMNAYGQKIATEAFLNQMQALSSSN